MSDVWEAIHKAVDEARSSSDSASVLDNLRTAKELVDGKINDEMAKAVIEGNSIRSVAHAAGFSSENSIGTRLGKSSLLSPYVREDGRITSAEAHVAQFAYRTQSSPMKFVPRKPSNKKEN